MTWVSKSLKKLDSQSIINAQNPLVNGLSPIEEDPSVIADMGDIIEEDYDFFSEFDNTNDENLCDDKL